MTYDEALKIFNITDTTEETVDTLRKKYKKLMIKYHPDNYKGDDTLAKDASVAFDLLKKVIETLSSDILAGGKLNTSVKKKKNLIISLRTLNKLYQGNCITIGNENHKREVYKEDLKYFNTLIELDINVKVNGEYYSYHDLMNYDISREYTISLDALVEKLDDPMDIEVSLDDETSKFQGIKSHRVIMILRPYNNQFKLNINLNKKIIDTNETKEENT
jgi:hypothetical protein